MLPELQNAAIAAQAPGVLCSAASAAACAWRRGSSLGSATRASAALTAASSAALRSSPAADLTQRQAQSTAERLAIEWATTRSASRYSSRLASSSMNCGTGMSSTSIARPASLI